VQICSHSLNARKRARRLETCRNAFGLNALPCPGPTTKVRRSLRGSTDTCHCNNAHGDARSQVGVKTMEYRNLGASGLKVPV